MIDNEGEEEMYDWRDEQYEDRLLDLCDKNIGTSDIRAFLKSLGDNPQEVSGLKIVDLSGNHIGAKNEDMQPVHDILTASSSSLTALNLCGNPLGEEQRFAGPVLALAKTLGELSRLKVLDLSGCTLIGLARHRYKGLNALGDAFRDRKNRLTHLRLCDNSLHSEAALIVAGWLPAVSKLRYLDISRNLLAADIFGQPSRAGFDPLCGALRTVLHLRTLRLGYCGLDDGEAEGVAAFLASSVRLESLDLSGNQIHTRGARLLARALRSNGTLVSLLLGGNRIGDEGAKLLVGAIPYTESLVKLDVSSNGLTDRVKEDFIDAALASITINTYRISGNNIPLVDEDVIREYAAANIELRRVADAPETYELWEASPIVEASLLAKFDRLPPGVAQALKGNPTFMDEDGPMREAVLRACPLSKSEMLERMPEETRAAIKAKATVFSTRFPGVAAAAAAAKDITKGEEEEEEVDIA